ncbi:tRNA (adenosine(37)-N6)-threonylcarbamoyltransferase complex dimerization subunit type 1 TsaB [Leptolyngbya sp. PCC 6406]|uniref:tRNA (adenosine(37)-N6)-threonylcarbamoyltransferase complex dimerization subunit type 1 TsaB n=1 Tax=Leptolyngbya sp. PCC 6406 TaxID=1173264 RepID=UPI0002AD0539|nr:tRNA (adenosine(37)-N6)-threonylcarbamoyltransferase complex dimerization subunit type 1 TsaB [Leptolyngbya sp. PCC 6406]
MLGLAIHTSGPGLGLALGGATLPLRHQTWPLGRELSAYLHAHLAAFIQPQDWGDLAFIAVAQGPGGFTGTRIGVVTARTLAQQLDLPLFGISSLAAMAQRHLQRFAPLEDTLEDKLEDSGSRAAPTPPRDLAVELSAQRGEVFGAIYTPTPTDLQVAYEERVQPQADWEEVLGNWPVDCDRISGDGDSAHAVTGVLSLALAQWQQQHRPHWSTVLPFYGQHPLG